MKALVVSQEVPYLLWYWNLIRDRFIKSIFVPDAENLLITPLNSSRVTIRKALEEEKASFKDAVEIDLPDEVVQTCLLCFHAQEQVDLQNPVFEKLISGTK